MMSQIRNFTRRIIDRQGGKVFSCGQDSSNQTARVLGALVRRYVFSRCDSNEINE